MAPDFMRQAVRDLVYHLYHPTPDFPEVKGLITEIVHGYNSWVAQAHAAEEDAHFAWEQVQARRRRRGRNAR